MAITRRYFKENTPFVRNGSAAFTTAATTVEIDVDLSVIEFISLTQVGDYGDNDHLEVDETLTATADGGSVIVVDADRQITIKRQASGTSGLTFQYRAEGIN